jgi:hypothetical protein
MLKGTNSEALDEMREIWRGPGIPMRPLGLIAIEEPLKRNNSKAG